MIKIAYNDLMSDYPSAMQVQQQLENYNQNNEAPPIKKDTLLAAGLGAGVGTGGAAAMGFHKGKQDFSSAAAKQATNFKKTYIDPHEFKATNPLFKLFNRGDANVTKKFRDSKIKELTDFATSVADPKVQRSEGLKALKKMPKSKLLMAGGAGAALAALANKVITRNQEQ